MKLKIGKKSGLKYFSYKDIKSWGPCYSPKKFISKAWRGTAVDILNLKDVPFHDKLWVILRTEICSEKLMRLFAVWSYRQTLNFISNPDPRFTQCADVAESYACGNATKEQLEAARSAAWSAAWSARFAAESAARSAARSAAESAAWSAAESAAESAAWSAARSAAESARSAAESAAWSAAWSARSAAESAAWSAAESAAESAARSARSAAWSVQRDKLIEMLIADGKERRFNKKGK